MPWWLVLNLPEPSQPSGAQQQVRYQEFATEADARRRDPKRRSAVVEAPDREAAYAAALRQLGR